MTENKIKWKSVQLPDVLVHEIEKKATNYGHPSVSSFVREACRWYLDRLKTKED